MLSGTPWTPKSSVSTLNMSQMTDNDDEINAVASHKLGYGLYIHEYGKGEYEIAMENLGADADFNSAEMSRGFIEQDKFFDIWVHSANEYWKFGVTIPRLYSTESLSDGASTTKNIPSFVTFFTLDDEDDTLTRLESVFGCKDSSVVAYSICGEFVHKFQTPGRQKIKYGLEANASIEQGATIKVFGGEQMQFYAMCMGT